MPVILYHLEGSPPVRTVDLVIHALEIPAEYKTVNLFEKEQLKPEYAKVNPLCTIPAIDDNGFILWDSHAIITYLVSKYGKDDSLYPKDLQKRAIVDQRLHYSNDVFYTIKQAVKAMIYFNKTSVSDELVEKLKEHQENVEKLLEGHKFMAGDSLTVADYSYITITDILETLVPNGATLPVTKAWYERCQSVMKDFDKVNTKGAQQLIGVIKQKLSS